MIGKIDVALFVVALVAHHRDFLTRMHADVAFGVGEFTHRNYAFGLVADVDDHILRCNFQHCSGDDLFVVQGGFGLGLLLLERFKGSGEIFHGRFFFSPGCRSGRLGRYRMIAATRRSLSRVLLGRTGFLG